MSSLHDRLTTAAGSVEERPWPAPADVAARGRRRTRTRRVAVAGATAGALVLVVSILASGGLRQARPAPPTHPSPFPTVLSTGCLVPTGDQGTADVHGQVLLAGQQLLRVDLASGQVAPQGACGDGWRSVIPTAHAQVLVANSGVTIRDSAGRTSNFMSGDHITDASPTPDGGVLVVQYNYPSHRDTSLRRYDAYGRLVAPLLKVAVDGGLFTVVGVTKGGIVAFGASPRGGLALVDPVSGKVHETLDATANWAVAVSGHLVAWRPHSLSEAVHSVDNGGRIYLSCTPRCQPIVVYDERTGTTREYPATTPSGRLYTNAAFSPDGTRLALATADDPKTRDGATVAVLDLATGQTTLMPGIPSVGEPWAPWLTWLPDNSALIVASSTENQVRLLAWRPGDTTLRPTVTLSGDPSNVSVAALSPGETAWSQH